MAKQSIGPYRIEYRLATGGMAEVFVAERVGAHGFSKRVALKRILPQYVKDPAFVAMFIDEARLAARLQHPNIVQVFDFGEADGELFLAMELVDGTNINRLLRSVSARGEAVPLDVALQVTAETAHALAHAHSVFDEGVEGREFVHRDVSPANILLTGSGHVKLTDFGIARVADREFHTDDGHVRGKLGYMSPEQVMGRPLGGRSDVFTLTIVFAEMLLGQPLFGREGSDLDVLLRIRDVDLQVLENTKRRIPQDVSRLLRMGLVRDPRKRPSSASFAEACEEIIRRRGVGYGPERVARLLQRLELLAGSGTPAQTQAHEAGGTMTSTVDTTGLSEEAARLLDQLRPTSPAVYRVRLPSGEEVGPLSFPRLVQMITSGHIHSETLISKGPATFAPATELPELTRFVTSPALQWRPDELADASRHGTLVSGKLLPLAFEFAVARETGVLHLIDGSRRKKIYFVDGRPEFVASTDRRELLGEHLVSCGLCMRMEVDMALAVLPRYGGRLGDALVGLGVLRPIELFRAIAEQVTRRYLEAFRWRHGQWAFVPRVRSQEEAFPLGQDPFELMRDAVLEAQSEELEASLEPMGKLKVRVVAAPPIALDAFRAPASWHHLISALDGQSSVEDFVAEHSKAGPRESDSVRRAVYLGLSCGLLHTA